jgi:hypothetical protein
MYTMVCPYGKTEPPPPINGSPFFFEIHHPYTGNALHAGWPVYVVEALSIGLFSGGVCGLFPPSGRSLTSTIHGKRKKLGARIRNPGPGR